MMSPARCLDHNVISPSERADGWKLLFDGESLQGWRVFGQKGGSRDCWGVRQGQLENFSAEVDDLQPCGDLVTVDQFVDFELTLEWQLQLDGNSGIKYLVSEDRPNSWEKVLLEYYLNKLKDDPIPDHEARARVSKIKWNHSAIGFELQLNQQRTNYIADTDSTGALYDLIAPVQGVNSPPGKFNQTGVVVRGDRVEHWVNATKVVEFFRSSQGLWARIERSKFRLMRGFGRNKRGHIVLQDHTSHVSFRNIKIKPLSEP